MGTRWLHFRLDEQLLEQARQAAAADRRSLSNWVGLVIERALPETPPDQPESPGTKLP
jgi:predicted HicB family RNase H-like nuclease